MREKCRKTERRYESVLTVSQKENFHQQLKVVNSRAGDLQCEDLRENQIETRALARSGSFACFVCPNSDTCSTV